RRARSAVLSTPRARRPTLFPYSTLFRSSLEAASAIAYSRGSSSGGGASAGGACAASAAGIRASVPASVALRLQSRWRTAVLLPGVRSRTGKMRAGADTVTHHHGRGRWSGPVAAPTLANEARSGKRFGGSRD